MSPRTVLLDRARRCGCRGPRGLRLRLQLATMGRLGVPTSAAGRLSAPASDAQPLGATVHVSPFAWAPRVARSSANAAALAEGAVGKAEPTVSGIEGCTAEAGTTSLSCVFHAGSTQARPLPPATFARGGAGPGALSS